MLRGSEEHRTAMRPKFPAAFELFYAVLDGNLDQVVARLNQGDDPNALSLSGCTPLMLAVRSDLDVPKAAALLAAGAKLDVWDYGGMHALHWASELHWAPASAIYERSAVSWLLDRGVDPNVAVRLTAKRQFLPVGWTSLHIAVRRDNLPLAMLLIARGAGAGRVAADGAAPLHVACMQPRVYKRLIRTLLEAGADPNVRDVEGKTPLHHLASGFGRYRKTAIRLLRFHGARLDLRDSSGLLPVNVVRDGRPSTDEIKRLLGSG